MLCTCSEESGFNLHFCEIDPLEVFDLQRNQYFKQYGYINMWIAIPYYILYSTWVFLCTEKEHYLETKSTQYVRFSILKNGMKNLIP